MFYEIVNNLCKERKTTITRMAEDIGLSNAAPTSWRKGSVPKLSTLEKISKYFNVSTDYLLGKENKKTPTPDNGSERVYGDAELTEAFMRADEATRAAIRLLLKLK